MASVTSLGVHGPSATSYLVTEGILPEDHTQSHYHWTRTDTGNGLEDEELLTTQDCVVWSRGGIARRLFRFDFEGQPVVQAAIAWFPKAQDHDRWRAYEPEAPSAPDTPRGPMSPSGSGHGRRTSGWSLRAQSYSSELYRPSENPGNQTDQQRRADQLGAGRGLSRALVIALRTQIHIYYFHGSTLVINLPFEVESILSAAQGVFIKRRLLASTRPIPPVPSNPPNSFALSLGESLSIPNLDPGSQTRPLATPDKPARGSQLSRSVDLGASSGDGVGVDEVPLLFTLFDPLMELGVVFTTEGRANPSRSRTFASHSGVCSRLSSDEELLWMSSPTDLAAFSTGGPAAPTLELAVTLNRRSGLVTVWKVLHAESRTLSSRVKRRTSSSSSRLSRRHGSLGPSPGTGASTPIAYAASAARESFGNDARDRGFLAPPALYGSGSFLQDEWPSSQKRQLATPLEMDPENDVISTEQSRRVSSLLARADFATSQSRLSYADASVGNPSAGKVGNRNYPRRSDSLGAYQARSSLAGACRAASYLSSFSTAASSESGSVHGDAMEDAVRDDDRTNMRGKGSGRSAVAMGSTGSVTLEKVKSLQAGMARDGHGAFEPRIFALISPRTACIRRRNEAAAAIFILDPQSRRLLTLNLGLKVPPHSSKLMGRRKHGLASQTNLNRTSVRLTGVREEANVVDAMKLVDKDISRAAILQRSKDGFGFLTIIAPGHAWIKLSLPQQFSMTTTRGLALPLPGGKRDKPSHRDIASGIHSRAAALSPMYNQGMLGLVDQEKRTHLLQVQLWPCHHQVAAILDLCRWILPDDGAGEGIVLTWWEVMRWMKSRAETALDREWTALIVSLMCLATPFLDGARPRNYPKTHSRTNKGRRSSAGSGKPDYWNEMLAQESGNIPLPKWTSGTAWDWCLSLERKPHELPHEAFSQTTRRVSDLARNIAPPSRPASAWNKNPLLLDCAALAKEFLSTSAGAHAIGDNGYLPVARGRDEELRRTALPTVVVALHLYREELKLHIASAEADETGMARLTAVLAQLGSWLGWESWSWKDSGYYSTEDVNMTKWDFDDGTIRGLNFPTQQFEPPSIYQWAEGCLSGETHQPFLMLPDMVSGTQMQVDGEGNQALSGNDEYWKRLTPRTPKVVALYQGISMTSGSPNDIVEKMVELGIDRLLLETLPEGLATPLRDAIAACQSNPPTTWGEEKLGLIGREDLRALLIHDVEKRSPTASQAIQSHEASRDIHNICNSAFETETIGAFDGVAEIDRHAITKLIFRDDRRFAEASRLVQSAKASVLRCLPEPDWSEADLLEAQKELVQTVAIRTLAVPSGRGLLYLSARLPLLTERFPIPGFNLSCIIKPSNTTVSADRTAFTEEKVGWAFFHAGVAAGLSISRDAKGIDTSWIMFNKPSELSNRHAGFLLALGLNGHLKSIAKWMAFKYLTPKHTMTSIGLLLGLAASYLGTMDPLVTRLLSVHITCMLPLGAAELNLSPLTQTTGLMATGLLYCNTQHRRMSEVMLSEMEQVDCGDPSGAVETLRDEGYRLAAGFALGFINLGKGTDLKGLHDMGIVPRLLNLAVGSKKADMVHILDKSMAGATVALALIFMKSHNVQLARKIDIPSAKPQFDYIRPDVFLLRTVAKHLIMWDDIEAKPAWIEANLPGEYRDKVKLKAMHALSSEDLPFLNIIAGLCFGLGLRFAGSSSTEARDLLGSYLDQFIRLCRLPAMTYDQKLSRSTVRNCQDLIALSLAAVMAGTGDVRVFRRLRSLHGRGDADTSYGSHFAAHMAIGILFLAGGTHTLGTSNLAVASLLCAFHPLFPTSILDNKCHLQAFRHLCVLATEPRCLVARDADTYRPVSIAVHLTLRDGTERRGMAPSLLPELHRIATVSTASSEHWRVVLDFARNPSHLASFQRNQSIYVRERAAHYTSDSTSIFHATLLALNEMEVSSSTFRSFPSSLSFRHRLEWLLSLPCFDIFDKAERTLLLKSDSTNSGGGGGSSSSNAGLGGGGGGIGIGIGIGTGSHSAVQDASTTETTLIDARLMLEKASLSADKADRLRNLRLLFAYADRAEREGLPLRWIKREVVDRLRAAVWMILVQDQV